MLYVVKNKNTKWYISLINKNKTHIRGKPGWTASIQYFGETSSILKFPFKSNPGQALIGNMCKLQVPSACKSHV